MHLLKHYDKNVQDKFDSWVTYFKLTKMDYDIGYEDHDNFIWCQHNSIFIEIFIRKNFISSEVSLCKENYDLFDPFDPFDNYTIIETFSSRSGIQDFMLKLENYIIKL